MDLIEQLRPGMRIFGPDGDDYGAINGYDSQAVFLADQRIPHSAIARVDGDRLYLKPFSAGPTDASDTSLSDRPTTRLPTADHATVGADGSRDIVDVSAVLDRGDKEYRLPLVEERLSVSTRAIDLGEIDVHKTVESVEETWYEPVTHEEVQVERVPVRRNVAAPEQPREEGEWLVIPVMEEVIVVQKQLVVVEEIRIRKQLVTEQQEIRETVRRERASVEDRRIPASAARNASLRDTDGPE
jgi:uncharacterized protein (TIGR02271 family)